MPSFLPFFVQSGNNHQANNTWEDDYSVSVSSGDKKLNQTQYSNTESVTNSEDLYHQENAEDPYLSDGTSTPLSIRKKFGRSDPGKSPEENSVGTAEDPNVYCKEVQCIQMEESGRVGNSESHALSNGVATDQQMVANPVNGEREESQMQNGFTYHALDERLHNVQRTIDSLARPHPEPGESSQPSMEKTDQIDSTPPNGMEKNFPGRPHSVRRRFPFFNYGDNNATLSRNNSQSSLDSEAQSIRTTADEDITSIHAFVAGLKKMAENQVQAVCFEKLNCFLHASSLLTDDHDLNQSFCTVIAAATPLPPALSLSLFSTCHVYMNPLCSFVLFD